MQPTSRSELIAAVDAGQSFRYLFFWGHRARRDGRLGPSCLSQWWPHSFTVAGVRYATAEHWMMAAKARLFGDAAAEAGVLASRTPKEAKAWGRAVQGFDPAIWDEHKLAIVKRGSVHKFGDPALGAYLMGTGDAVLVEASVQDLIWGIGLTAKDSGAHDPREWRGENLLGFALMAARAELMGG